MNTFIFDLDGTLLPMPDQEHFINSYAKVLSTKMIPFGYDPKELMKAVWTGTKAMIENDGTMTNEQRFWSVFCAVIGEEARELESRFDDFYRNEFEAVRAATSSHPLAPECIRLLKEKGYTLILATNPVFPKVATYARLGWAGLQPSDFEHITTYENSSYCKPNLEYYKEILQLCGKQPSECIMVGNDVNEDMCAAKLGMEIFLLKDCLICPEGLDISKIAQGGFEELLALIRELPRLN